MAATVIPFGDPKAQKKWSVGLAVDSTKKSYFENRFIGTDENNIIQRKTELEGSEGDLISFDLSVQMRNEPTYGDARLEGKEESLKFFTDQVRIDQVRHAASAGGKMTRKRTSHNLRTIARDRLGNYFARLHDELFFMYLSGARGINEDFIHKDLAYAGFAGNAFSAPDAAHLLYGGVATSKASLAVTDIMTTDVIERADVKANMMQAQDPTTANMVPVSIGSEDHYVCVMTKFQEHDMRTASGSKWLDIQKAAAAAEGRKNPIFVGGLGMIKDTVLHSHRNVIRFADYGAGANVKAARALFMGRQAAVVAYGTTGGLRYNWEECQKDYNNEPSVASGFIGGMKKTTFNSKDFGVLAIDTAAKDPNA